MKKIKLLFVCEDDFELDGIEDLFSDSSFTVVGKTHDGIKGRELIDALKPDFVVLGMVLGGIDGFGIIKHIGMQKDKCKIVVLSALRNERVIQKAIDYGASYYMVTPVNEEILKERLENIYDEKTEEALMIKKKPAVTLDEAISKIFLNVGIPPHIKGYVYLREGVKMAVDNPRIINSITKELYPMIGDKYGTTASKVERAIRHAIEVAWNRNRTESINAIFGVRAYVASEKPTNGEFIALVADKMLLERS